MFSVCLFTGAPPGVPPQLGGAPLGVTPPTGGAPGVPSHWGGGAPGGTPQLGHPLGYPPNWGGCPQGGGAPGGTPPTKNGQSFGQKMDKNWTNILETFGGGGARAVRLLRSRRRTVLSYYVFSLFGHFCVNFWAILVSLPHFNINIRFR